MVNCVAFSPDGGQVVSGSWDKTVRVWDVRNGTELHRFEGHKEMVTSVGFSPDGRHVVSGSLDQTVRLWDIETAHCRAIFPCDTYVHAIAVSRQSPPRIAVGQSDGHILFFQLEP